MLTHTSVAVLGTLVGWAIAAGDWRPLLLGVGLALVILFICFIRAGLRSSRRSSPVDTLGWCLARSCILTALRAAMRTVLSTREFRLSEGPTRLLPLEIGALLKEVEPMAARLRTHAALADLPGVSNRLMVELAVFTAAAYRVLLDAGWSTEDARRAISDAGWILYARMLRLSSLPFRLTTRDPAQRLRCTIQALLRFPFDAPGPPGYEVTVTADTAGIRTHFSHCPPQTFVRALVSKDDRGDLEAFRQSWCRYDWPGADLIAGHRKRGHYSRAHTLSHGDAVCDMCWRGQVFAGTPADECSDPDVSSQGGAE